MPSRTLLANAIRVLSMDAVEKAKSGHPGAPMGMADISEVLWNDFMRHNPANPKWANRDRFVLSNGHGSMLIYSLLHLTGYDLPMEELKNFRQLHSKTPGHPENILTPGVETTTGPLGQGISNAVGMAIAEKVLGVHFNRPDHTIVDHYTYCFLGDGCMMEGISHESCSLAGTLKLNKLIAVYDDNGISIDGEVEGWFTDDTPGRFEAYGWRVIRNVDGHDSEAIKAAFTEARTPSDKPTLICCKTVIGSGAPNKEGTHGVHGAALGADEVAATRKALGWEAPPFEISAEIYEGWDAKAKGADLEAEWNEAMAAYRKAYPDLAAEFERRAVTRTLPESFAEQSMDYVRQVQKTQKDAATRKASQAAIESYASMLPELFGGSADLGGSNLTYWDNFKALTGKDADGNYVYYGVREFGMTGIMTGIALHGGFVPFGGTFLMFSEYARNAVRMAALNHAHSIMVYTHDSIGQGEDGPTHQAVEQLHTLRMTPNLQTWRPCDAAETAVAWRSALMHTDGPSALVFTRQTVAAIDRTDDQLTLIERGGYILQDCDGEPEAIIIATGSEVALATAAATTLNGEGRRVRVVSMPSTGLFDAQDDGYKESVLPAAVTARVAVEATHADYWYKYVGFGGAVVGMTTFGESAPGEDVLKYFGFTPDNVLATVRKLLK